MAGEHFALDPAGPQAALIEQLWWLFFWTGVATYVIVVAALVYVLVTRARSSALAVDSSENERRSRRLGLAVGAAVGVTIVTLVTLAISDFVTARAIVRNADHPLRIYVTGHQWWWELEYDDPVTSNRFRTANELHIPVGRPVELVLTARDVIHSFWVPSIHGKKDLIPGHTTRSILIAGRPGVYEGQCAEFCGHQHARMRLVVYADPAERFERWRERQRQPARTPTTAAQWRGRQVFLDSSCIMCHAIDGTPAGASVAPNLTHLASRRTIAAGTLPNTRGHLAGWIANPQGLKPGSRMPNNAVAPGDLQPLLDYLTSLQ